MESIFDHAKNVDLQCAHLGETLRVVLNGHLSSDNDQNWKNDKTTSPNNTEISPTALWFLFVFCFPKSNPATPRKEKQKSPPHFCGPSWPVFLGLPNRQVTISGDSFPIQCHHPPGNDEDSKLVACGSMGIPSISNINPQKMKAKLVCPLKPSVENRPLKE